MPDTKQVPLSAETRLELASMAYARWSAAFDAHKAAKAETWESAGRFCPRDEWPLFHARRLNAARTELDKAARIKDEICPHSPLGEQM